MGNGLKQVSLRWTFPLVLRAILHFSVSLWFFFLLPLHARAVDEHGTGPDAALVSRIDAILQEETGLKGGFQGIVIQSLREGSVWYERNPEILFLPASNQKLLTSAAILNALGPDWRYATLLLRAGTVDAKGTLRGSLYLKGSGDPLLEDEALDEFVQAVKRAGIRRLAGRVLGDDSRFDRRRYGDGWAWDDMPWYYSAQISALNLNENLVRVKTEPGAKPGDPVRVTVTPDEGYVKVVLRAKTGPKGSKSALFIGRELGRNRITVDGALAQDAKPEEHRPAPITVESPARYAAVVLTSKLRRAGVRVDGEGREGVAPQTGAVEIGRHLSPPLKEILKRLNKPSDNLVAECMLKTLGAEKGTTGAGTTAAGREAALAWFKSIGMDPNGVDMADGSGLSRQNYVSPRNLAKLLQTMYTHPSAQVFLDSLPVAGVDGTLRNRMKGTPAEKNCRAKSGYVSGVSSLSGYVTTKDGEPLLFVILMNNHRARNAVAMAVQNKIVELLASWEKPKVVSP
jgi:D-alanyl-D-alanine carboxypeptidase/D-alanyl-D-alanine-endopeptidase (penicillin-binding protein 4)